MRVTCRLSLRILATALALVMSAILAASSLQYVDYCQIGLNDAHRSERMDG